MVGEHIKVVLEEITRSQENWVGQLHKLIMDGVEDPIMIK
jgi:hypothetical protein